MQLPQRIVIVGGGTAGWMAASIFLQAFGRRGTGVSLIESSNIPTVGVGEGSIPFFKRFLQFLEIPEAEFMSACNATYKHGINFPGWTDSEEFHTYFHPFSTPEFSQYHGHFFNNCNLRRHGKPADTDPGNFFFGAEMARQRKAPAGPPPCNPDIVGYAYHFDAGLVAEFLKRRALERGINHIIDDVTDVAVGNDGEINHLVTASGEKLEADLFADCTGFARRLIGKALGSEAISYRPRMFNDRAVVMRTPLPRDVDIPPFTESRALKYGWAWRIPLVSRIGWGYVYSSDYTTEEDAEKEFRDLIGEDAKDQPARHLKMQTGRVTEHWKKNCVAIGLSQGFIEPLEATALGLTQFTINRFVAYYQEGGFQPAYRGEFNRLINDTFDSVLDYIQMHYKLNTRDDTRYWRDCRENENISDAMRGIIEGWDRTSQDFNAVLAHHARSYAPYSWYCILSGMGRFPQGTAGASVARTANPYSEEVSRYFSHRQYLESIRNTG